MMMLFARSWCMVCIAVGMCSLLNGLQVLEVSLPESLRHESACDNIGDYAGAARGIHSFSLPTTNQ